VLVRHICYPIEHCRAIDTTDWTICPKKKKGIDLSLPLDTPFAARNARLSVDDRYLLQGQRLLMEATPACPTDGLF
jgi:hypothetical protein